MLPRKALGTVPAAFVAEDARTISGLATSSFLRSDAADTATSLVTFSGGIISSASSTVANLTAGIAHNNGFTVVTVDGFQRYSADVMKRLTEWILSLPKYHSVICPSRRYGLSIRTKGYSPYACLMSLESIQKNAIPTPKRDGFI